MNENKEKPVMIENRVKSVIPRIIGPDGAKIDKITEYFSMGRITSLVGGGGKTSSMLTIGRELAEQGNRVIMTTTTRIRPFSESLPDNLRCVGNIMERKGQEPSDTRKFYDSETWNGQKFPNQWKLGPLDCPDEWKRECDYLLIEADGSKGLPVKVPENHEPVITEGSKLIIAVIGLTGVGKPIHLVGHRIHRICELLGKGPEEIVTPQDMAKIITSDQGLHKNVGDRSYAVIMNQADTQRELAYGREIARLLPPEIPCLMTSYYF